MHVYVSVGKSSRRRAELSADLVEYANRDRGRSGRRANLLKTEREGGLQKLESDADIFARHFTACRVYRHRTAVRTNERIVADPCEHNSA